MFRLLFIVFFIVPAFYCSAQTIGIGDVVSIEAKSNTILSNKNKIEQFKIDLIELEKKWLEKINKLKDEIIALQKERDNLIRDMKVGARCSQCGGWKSDFEKRGENFEKHLGDVKGYAIPATTAELEATRTRFAEKIALKRVQLQNLEKGDNDVIKKQKDLKQLEVLNEKLCKEITEHSKNYETKLLADAKSKHEQWTNMLMDDAINILIADDKISIQKERIIRYEKEFQDESIKVKEAVKKENEEAQTNRKSKIIQHQDKIKNLHEDKDAFINPLQYKLNGLKKDKIDVDQELKNYKLSDSAKTQLLANQKNLYNQINDLVTTIKTYTQSFEKNVNSLKKEIQDLNNEIFQLKVNLNKQQDEAVIKIKPLYDQKKIQAKQAEQSSVLELTTAKKMYIQKEDFYKKKNDDFVNEIGKEASRMFVASQKVACSVWNSVRGNVNTNWSQVLPCVSAITKLAKPYSSNVFNSYCPGVSAASYMSKYKSFLRSLNEDDKEAIRKNSNVSWFELMTQ
ncbi:MAG: hypothetical protein KGZ59_08230 [Chitinophagaceae bacterium]|nr:hypothetical protein [Chitinophagaceae bacterium]